jgi:hypothetical protein
MGTGAATKALVSYWTFGFWITPGEASLDAAAAPDAVSRHDLLFVIGSGLPPLSGCRGRLARAAHPL